jgi:hypothetical protein
MTQSNVHRSIETGMNIFYGMQPRIVKELSSASKAVRFTAVDQVVGYIVKNAPVPVIYVCVMLLRRMITRFGKAKHADYDTQYDKAMHKIEMRFEKMIKHKRTSTTITAYSTLVDSFTVILEELCAVFGLDPADVLEDSDDESGYTSDSSSSRRRSYSSASSEEESVSTSFEFSEEEE